MPDTSGSIARRNRKDLRYLLVSLLQPKSEGIIKQFTMIDENAFALRSTIILINEGENCYSQLISTE